MSGFVQEVRNESYCTDAALAVVTLKPNGAHSGIQQFLLPVQASREYIKGGIVCDTK